MGDNVIHAAIVHLAGVQHGKAVVFIELSTNTNLHGMIRVDQTFFRRGIEHGAVVKFTTVRIGVGVGVKVYQRHFAEMLRMSTQQRQRNKVVTTEGEHTLTGSQQLLGVRLQLLAHLTGISEGIYQIAAVHHVQALTHVEIPREAVVFPGQIRRNLTDSSRTVASTRTTRSGHIERHASNHPVSIAVIWLEVHRQA